MTKDDVIKELESLGFTTNSAFCDIQSIVSAPNFSYPKFSYVTWSHLEEIWFYNDECYHFKFNNGEFYRRFGVGWTPIQETDISTIIVLYVNSKK